uniref:hypothetical protein n=1 Tax=Bidens pilosa TaxID=42337 RepID=UPI001FF391B7|nr:hypothetical protein MZG22_mgp40 [Bidens pilosa]UIR99244.1 hypothetical protein [Bidens pilosa]
MSYEAFLRNTVFEDDFKKIKKDIYGVLFISLSNFLLIILNNILVESENVQMITRFMGGSSAIYFLLLAKKRFSKLLTLFSFLVNTCYLFVLNHPNVPDIGLVPICVCSSFIFSYYFIETQIMDKYFDQCFIIIITCRAFVSPDIWLISFVFELLVLFSLRSRYMDQDRKGLCLYLILLLFLCCHYQNFTGNHIHLDHLIVVLVLAAAGAGGIQFMSLSKTERGETLGLTLFLINNVFLLRKDDEILPMITRYFLVSILCFCIGLYLIGRIKEQSFYSVLSEFKSTLRGVFIPVLSILNHLFLEGEYSLWITSLVTRIIVIQVLQLILKKEDEDPDQDKAIKSDDVRR